jgi:hypothetical protein
MSAVISLVEVRLIDPARQHIQGALSGCSVVEAAVSSDFSFAEFCVNAMRGTSDAPRMIQAIYRN